MNLNINTEGSSSPKGWRYVLLHSPRNKLQPVTLPFLIIFFGVGFLLGGTVWSNTSSGQHWYKPNTKYSLKTDPHRVGGGMVWSSGDIQYQQHSNTSGTQAVVSSKTGIPNQEDKKGGSLPLCWLMSFPNSGTSYTSLLVRTVTGTNTASNYGKENCGEDGTSVPVFPEESPWGPFYSNPLSPSLARPTSGFILTKTHCGGRCNQCGPNSYVESSHTFSHRCFEGDRIIKDANNQLVKVSGSYYNNKDVLVAKAVHLIRDPFDNVVSRFHLSYKEMLKKNETDWLVKFPKSREGFRSFCKDQSKRYRRDEQKSKFYTYVFGDAKDVPCHADFFRFVQWHNLAFITTAELGIPTMVIHYENYTTNFNQTKDMLLDFLDQEDKYEPPLFVTGKTYDYFDKEEKTAVARMFNKLAHKKTWGRTKHYFDE